jgi:prepilin-type N-terminal cleavage/methylation domain-containing protein
MTATVRPRHGLTLIELVVAIAITGLALSAGYGVLSWMTEARRAAEERTDALWRAAAVRRAIEGWLAGATLAVAPDVAEFRGLDGVRDRLDDDAITFRTTAPTPLGGAETVVTLAIDHEGDAGSRGLVARFAEPHGPRRTMMELEPHAVALQARYLSGVSGAERWSDSWVSTTVLPRGVELRISAARGDSLPAILRLPFVVPFASGM